MGKRRQRMLSLLARFKKYIFTYLLHEDYHCKIYIFGAVNCQSLDPFVCFEVT